MKKYILLAFLFVFGTISPAFAELTLTITDFHLNDLPRFTATVAADIDGIPAELDVNNVVILEKAFYSTKPLKVEKIAAGQFKIVWISQRNEFFSNNSYTIEAWQNGQIGQAGADYENPNLPYLKLSDPITHSPLTDLGFSPSDFLKQIYMEGAQPYNGNEKPVRLDSITLTSSDYRVEVLGVTQWPMMVSPLGSYFVDIYYQGPGTKATRDYITFHFGGGIKKSISLVAGDFSITPKSNITLIQPNGNEILAPCQKVDIKWKGHNKEQPVIIQYSINGGDNWIDIAEVIDSVYKWTVPNDPSDNVLVRVGQTYDASTERVFVTNNYTAPIYATAFNSNGTRVLSCNSYGNLLEWNPYGTTAPEVMNYYSLAQAGLGACYPLAIGYTKDNEKIAAVYYQYSRPLPQKIAFFDVGSELPTQIINVPDNFFAIKAMFSKDMKKLFLIPSLGTKIMVLNAEDGSFDEYIDAGVPIDALTVSRDGGNLAVALVNGIIQFYNDNSGTFTLAKTLDKSDLFRINQMTFSPDEEYLVISMRGQEISSSIATYIYEFARDQIVRTYQPTNSLTVGLEFSPSSNSLIIGSRAQQQVQMHDLTGMGKVVYLNGHMDLMETLILANEGNNVLTSSKGDNNLRMTTVSYPETDYSDNPLRIVAPKLDITPVTLSNIIIGSENTYTYTANLCNTGIVDAFMYNVKLQNSKHMKLLAADVPDTLSPGECKTVSFIVQPLDTGKLADEIVFGSCQSEIRLPIEIESINRKLNYQSAQPYDMGEACVWTAEQKIIDLVRNDDTIDVHINYITVDNEANSKFSLVNPVQDTILKPGEVLKAEIRFVPTELGPVTGTIRIWHSNQANVSVPFALKGTGIGTYIETSHQRIMFIPEINKRTITIKNTGTRELDISAISTSPEGYYKVNTAVPVKLAGNASMNIEIERIQTFDGVVNLNLTATPCLVNANLTIENYSGTAVLTLPQIEVDPRGEASIPISFRLTENAPYKGERFFEGELVVNQGHFYPQEISSEFGTSEILSNTTVGKLRFIKFRITGDFDKTDGALATIKGVGGLNDTASSLMDFTNPDLFFGTAVKVTTQFGKIQLTGLCGNRRIYSQSNGMKNLSVSPNPADQDIEIDFDSEISGEFKIMIYDNLGKLYMETNNLKASVGNNKFKINIGYLKIGSYRLIIVSDEGNTGMPLLIVR